ELAREVARHDSAVRLATRDEHRWSRRCDGKSACRTRHDKKRRRPLSPYHGGSIETGAHGREVSRECAPRNCGFQKIATRAGNLQFGDPICWRAYGAISG